MVKRLADRTAAALLLVIAAPLMALIGLAIRWTTSGPALFRQERIGRGERPFTIFKFRSMRDARGPDGEPLPDGDRLTRIGRILRRTSLDELPQLWNVLRGELSLVGPRPLLPRYLPWYTERERLRHTVPPGITGWAQTHGRNLIDWDERLARDVWYVENWSLRLDVEIILRTIRSVVMREGVVVDPRADILDLDQYRQSAPVDGAVRVRLARPPDAEAIVSVLRAGLGDAVTCLTVYGCHGAAAFVADRIRGEGHGRDFAYLVGLHGGEVVGCAEIAIGEREVHVNQLSVSPGRQGLGVGRSLLKEAVLTLCRPSHREVRLDVFEHNERARSWYARLGFREESATLWYQGAVRDDRKPHDTGAVRGLRDALSSLDTYGFGRFRIAAGGRTHTIGMLGAHWFRITESETYEDPLVHRALGAIGPGRDIIASWPWSGEAVGGRPPERLMSRSYRLSADIETLRRALHIEPFLEYSSTANRYSAVTGG